MNMQEQIVGWTRELLGWCDWLGWVARQVRVNSGTVSESEPLGEGPSMGQPILLSLGARSCHSCVCILSRGLEIPGAAEHPTGHS